MDKDWWWGIEGLSENPSITPEFIEKHASRPWYWRCFRNNTFKISEQRIKEKAAKIIQRGLHNWLGSMLPWFATSNLETHL